MDKRSGFDRKADERRHSGSKGINAYDKMSSTQKRDELVKKHLNLVSFIVSRLAIGLPSWIDKRDLISSGVLGLIDAAKNFDQKKGVKFATYASTRIKGAIIDELRSLDWVPRSTREKSKQVEETILLLIAIAIGLAWVFNAWDTLFLGILIAFAILIIIAVGHSFEH